MDRGAGLDSRRKPAFRGDSGQQHYEMDPGWNRDRIYAPKRISGNRTIQRPRAWFEWHDSRCGWQAYRRRTRTAQRLAVGINESVRTNYSTGRLVPRQEVEQPERSGLSIRWIVILHRSSVWLANTERPRSS